MATLSAAAVNPSRTTRDSIARPSSTGAASSPAKRDSLTTTRR